MDPYDQQKQQGSSGGSPLKQQYNGATYQDAPIETNQKIASIQRGRLPEPYDFRIPDKVEADKLNGKYGKAVDFIEKRINVLGKITSELIEGEEKFIVDENKLIEEAIAFIDENILKFKELAEKEVEMKAKLEIGMKDRLREFQAAQLKASEAKMKVKEIEVIMLEQAKQLLELNPQKISSAMGIEKTMQQFRKIKIREPNDIGHNLFKWFLGVIYNESLAKYDFENFKKEVFKNDKGADFVERLKGFRVIRLGKEETAQTSKLLSLEKEISDHINQKKKVPLEAVQACFGYVKIIDKMHRIIDEVHKNETELEAVSKKVDIADAELDKFSSRKTDAEANIEIAVKAVQAFEAAYKLFLEAGQKFRERQKHSSKNLLTSKKSTVEVKKTELVVEAKAQDEETAFGTVSNKETHHLKQARSGYQSDFQEMPPEQKEGCKCTIF